MKVIGNILVIVGILALIGAVGGHFIGRPQIVMGFKVMNIILIANSVLLIAILLKLSEKK